MCLKEDGQGDRFDSAWRVVVVFPVFPEPCEPRVHPEGFSVNPWVPITQVFERVANESNSVFRSPCADDGTSRCQLAASVAVGVAGQKGERVFEILDGGVLVEARVIVGLARILAVFIAGLFRISGSRCRLYNKADSRTKLALGSRWEIAQGLVCG